MDPTDPEQQRRFIVLESALDSRIADIPNTFTKDQYFKQLVASLLRGDKDLGIGNLGGDVLADVGTAGNLIDASDIYDVLTAETANYTSIRKIRALLFVEGSGGNTGTQSTAGFIVDETRKAYMSSSYLQTLPVPQNGNVVSGETTSAGNLETLFANLVNAYANPRENIVTVQVNVCHASCHSSCHGSRGRR
jgi:hypothetical protein